MGMTPEPTNAELLSEATAKILPWFDYSIARTAERPGGYAETLKAHRGMVVLLIARLRVSDTNCAKAIDQLATATARVSALEAENAALRARCEAREEWPKEKEVTV